MDGTTLVFAAQFFPLPFRLNVEIPRHDRLLLV